MKENLKFNMEGMKGLHFFTDQEFPVVIATYSEREEYMVSCLEKNYNNQKNKSTEIAKWCIYHNIQYQILYLPTKTKILKNIYEYVRFKIIQFKLLKK